MREPVVSHFLLTRFNVKLSENSTSPSADWLATRLQHFVEFCVASMQGQSQQCFSWLVFVDEESPQWFKSRLHEIRDASGHLFEAVYITGQFNGAQAGRAIRNRTTAPSILTTRVDNDDAVARDFVEIIQRSARGKFEFINLIDGAQLSAAGVYRRPYPSNPFVSVFEPLREGELPRTVFMDEHPDLGKHGPIRDVRTGHAMWMQVVHGENIANEVVGLRVSAERLRPWFDIDLPRDADRFNMFLEQTRDAVRIAFRLALKPSRILALVRAMRV